VTFTVPPSRGTTSTVSVVRDGVVSGSLGSFPVGGSGATTQVVTVPGNGTNYALALRDCNEKVQCSTSNAVTVNAYGPIPAPSVTLNKLNGTTFSVDVNANGNGRQITVHITTDSGHSWSFTTTGPNGWSSGGYPVSYSQTDRAHVTITDTAGRSVPGQVDSNTQTADPPPVAVTVSKGGSAKGQPGCDSSACYYIVATTANFTSGVSCSVSTQTPSTGYRSWTQGANAAVQSPNYYGWPGQWVRVTCTDGQGHSATGQITW
jgi:hypothetical protein